MKLEDFVISKWTAQDVRDIAAKYFFNEPSDNDIIAISKRLLNGTCEINSENIAGAIEDYIQEEHKVEQNDKQ